MEYHHQLIRIRELGESLKVVTHLGAGSYGGVGKQMLNLAARGRSENGIGLLVRKAPTITVERTHQRALSHVKLLLGMCVSIPDDDVDTRDDIRRSELIRRAELASVECYRLF